jgi:hypothetical protein
MATLPYTNELRFGYPLLKPLAWPQEGSNFHRMRYDSGFEDAWDDGSRDEMLAGKVIMIPAESGLDTNWNTNVTGWNGAAGWRAFLESARDGDPFQFWRDQDNLASAILSYLVEPKRDGPNDAWGMTRDLDLQIRSATPFDGY